MLLTLDDTDLQATATAIYEAQSSTVLAGAIAMVDVLVACARLTQEALTRPLADGETISPTGAQLVDGAMTRPDARSAALTGSVLTDEAVQ